MSPFLKLHVVSAHCVACLPRGRFTGSAEKTIKLAWPLLEHGPVDHAKHGHVSSRPQRRHVEHEQRLDAPDACVPEEALLYSINVRE